MEFKELLHEEISDELESLKNLEIGAEEYKNTVDGIAKLMDRAIEIDKINNDNKLKRDQFDDDVKNRIRDSATDRLKIVDEKKDRWIKNGLSAAGIVIPVIVTIWGTKKSLDFEREGTVTTIMGRGFINKLLPRK